MAQTEQYIVVEDIFGALGGVAPRGEADVDAQQAVAAKLSDDLIQVAELTSREARAIEHSPRMIAAQIMPTKLLHGLVRDPAGSWSSSKGIPVAPATGASPAVAWGVQAVGAADDGDGGELASVAMLDTGIDRTHAAFAEIGDEIEEKDFTGTGNGDTDGHGTHCAGVIFGRDCHGHRIGIARRLKRVFVGKVLDDHGQGTSDALLQGLKWALDRRADVISVSIGYDFPGMVELLHQRGMPLTLATSKALAAYRQNLRALDAVMTVARAQATSEDGSVILAATGNESHAHIDPRFRVDASLPAAAQDAIGVAAVERSPGALRIADFSNGLPILSAPGVDIVSAAPGDRLLQMSGTSMACPHAAGVAALWWDHLRRNGGATARRVASFLSVSARTGVFDPAFSRAEYGDGLVAAPGLN